MVTADEVLNKLIELDFFKFAQASDLDRICTNIKENWTKSRNLASDDACHDSLIPLDRRFYHADAEDLAEQGVCDFINGMRPILECEGVQIESLRDDVKRPVPHEYIYTVWVNEQEYRICDTTQGEEDCWCFAHKRTIEIINSLLIDAGSQERVYGVASGNGAGIVLLSDELHAYIRSLYENDPSVLFKAEAMNCA
jgi:hypothetical protein